MIYQYLYNLADPGTPFSMINMWLRNISITKMSASPRFAVRFFLPGAITDRLCIWPPR